MNIKENVTVYQCEHCKKKKLFRKHAMELHEKYCGANPETQRLCSYCTHMHREDIEYYFDTVFQERDDGSGDATANGFYCEKLKTYVYPFFIEKKPFFKDHPEQFEDQIPMKKECEYFIDERGEF